MTKRTSKMDRKIAKWVNSLSTEQYGKLLDVAHGEVPQDIRNLSDDELMRELAA